MKVLGAVIARGLSTRFGSDKALAMIDGRATIEHAIDALRPQVEAILVWGREWPAIGAIADRPARGIRPLGGLNAALHHAVRSGHDAVLCGDGCRDGSDIIPRRGAVSVVVASQSLERSKRPASNDAPRLLTLDKSKPGA
ncbi:MAG TPA: NTP transferase domain-containing protein [Sphingomonas sp.]